MNGYLPPSGYNPNFNQITGGKGGDWDAMYRHVTVLREWALISRTTPQEIRGNFAEHVLDIRTRANLQRGFRLRETGKRINPFEFRKPSRKVLN